MSIIYFACALNIKEVSQAVGITSLWHTLFYLHVKWIRCRRVNMRWMKKLSDFSNRICLYHSLCSHHSYLNTDTGTIWFESVFNMPSCPPTYATNILYCYCRIEQPIVFSDLPHIQMLQVLLVKILFVFSLNVVHD